MDHPYQPDEFIKQDPADHVMYEINEVPSNNMQVAYSELTSSIVTSQSSHIDGFKVKQEVITLDPFVTQIKTEANPYSEDINIKLEPTEETNMNEDIKIKTDTLSNKTGRKQFNCQLCNYSCAHKGIFRKHKTRHMNNCNICKFEATSKRKLNLHILNTHPGEKPYKCTLCEFRAPMKPLLNEHRKTHMGKIFLCELCDFRTLSINELLINQHMKGHEGAKIFICYPCGYKSLKKSCYRRHMRKKHNNDLESIPHNMP